MLEPPLIPLFVLRVLFVFSDRSTGWGHGYHHSSYGYGNHSQFAYCNSTGMAAPSAVTMAAIYLHCPACNRGFGSVQGVLQHLRDFGRHKDSVEAAEVTAAGWCVCA
jgi:hypothetical protein